MGFHVGNQEEDWENSLDQPSFEGKEQEEEDCEEGREVEDGCEEDLHGDYCLTPGQIKTNQYVADLWRQSESDLESAEVLQSNHQYAQAIFCYQKASEKGSKAVLLQKGYEN